jgi:hypothetical protein
MADGYVGHWTLASFNGIRLLFSLVDILILHSFMYQVYFPFPYTPRWIAIDAES